jgi:glycosyltransferase involved in cell wall biosynthesis
LLGVTNPTHKAEVIAYFKINPNIEVVIPDDIDWQDEIDIYKRIAQFDVGIAPLLNSEMNQSKSAFKLKQCLSCGVPVLASSVGENVHYLNNGINGYYCNTPDEYLHRINELIDTTPAEYERLIENARNSISPFTMKNYCEDFITYCN